MTEPRPRLSFAGLLCGALFAVAALGPSLLPRSALVAGLLAGATGALGYGIGAGSGWIVRRLRRTPDWRSAPWQRRVAAAMVVVAVLVPGVGAWRNQVELAGLMGVPAPGAIWLVVAILVAGAVGGLAVLCARGIRHLTLGLRNRLARVAPRPVATASSISLIAALGILTVGRLPVATSTLLSPMFESANGQTSAGLVQPSSRVVSGSPTSAVTWQSLGHDGRDFVGGVTSAQSITAFTGRRAQAPIRVYVGVDSSPDASTRAALAVADLDRFRAWDRSVIAIGTSTGTGTVDQGEVEPLEYLLGGDVATVSTQYSVLPSFLSFLVDGKNAQDAATTLFAAVHRRWLELPEDRRPRLVVFGESLGAYGGDAPFADLTDLAQRTAGGLFVGPPNDTDLWQELTEERTPGTPERLPKYDDGAVVRWADHPDDLGAPPYPWGPTRLVYLQNASDPVVWWSPDTAWSRPDWLAEPRGGDVLPQLTWLPLFTFVGLTGDMINSQSVPPGHGHVYGGAPAAAWARIIAPPGWTTADTRRLVEQS